MKTYFSQHEIDNLPLSLKVGKDKQLQIYNKNNIAMVSYADYRKEQLKTSTIPHYGILWNQRKIYKKGGVC